MVGNVLPRVTDETVTAKTDFLEFKERSYLNKFGDERRWSMVSRAGGGRAVMIVPYHGNKIVVTREFRAPVGGRCYCFPSGQLAPGEDAAAGAGRVLHVRTGLNIAEIQAVSRPVFNSPGITDETVTLVYARVKGTASKKKQKPDEEIETLFLDRKQVVALMNDEHCRIDTRTWIELYHFLNVRSSKRVQKSE